MLLLLLIKELYAAGAFRFRGERRRSVTPFVVVEEEDEDRDRPVLWFGGNKHVAVSILNK